MYKMSISAQHSENAFLNVIQGYVDNALEFNKNNKSCHVALLLQGKKVVSYGFNQMDRQCFRGKSVLSVHAEIDCLRKCRPIKDIIKRNYTLVIVKLAKDINGTFIASMPCKSCTKFIKGLNFKKVYCSNNQGQIVKINLNEYVPYNNI